MADNGLEKEESAILSRTWKDERLHSAFRDE